MQNKDICAIVLAAGSGSRMNNIKKQFLKVNDKPLIYYSLKTLSCCDNIKNIIVVTKEEDVEYTTNIIKEYNFKKVIKTIKGGALRQDSVYSGLKCVPEEFEYVLIHDSARPFIKKEDVLNVINDGIKYNSATLGVKVKDTVKEIDNDGFVNKTLDRDKLVNIQTPQVANKSMLTEGFNKFNDRIFTDDTSILEAMGIKTKITFGDYSNIKITTKEDLIYLKDLI